MSDSSGYNPINMGAVTYDSNGYINSMVDMPNETDPWTAMAAQSSQNYQSSLGAQANIPGMQQQAAQQTSALQAYATATAKPAATSSYPAMENDYGLGQQNAPADASARGNPWMLKGDALSR